MSDIIWPDPLPKSPLAKGFWREPRPNFVQTQFEVGTPSTRLRTTANIEDMSCPYSMNPSQFKIFQNFFRASIAFGSLSFMLPDPENSEENLHVQFREKAYRQEKITAQEYIVTLPLMILPQEIIMDIDGKKTINKQRVGARFTTLVTIAHKDLPEPIRVCDDLVKADENGERKIISRGETYYCYGFKAKLPDHDHDRLSGVQLAIANVDRMIVDTIRNVVGKPDVTIEQVLSTKPDTLQNGPFKWHLTSADYDAVTVTGELGLPEDWGQEPFGRRFKRTNFLGMA